MVAHPEQHPQYIAVMFGQARFEKDLEMPPTIDRTGHLHAEAHSWAQQLVKDIRSLQEVDDVCDFVEGWGCLVVVLWRPLSRAQEGIPRD